MRGRGLGDGRWGGKEGVESRAGEEGDSSWHAFDLVDHGVTMPIWAQLICAIPFVRC